MDNTDRLKMIKRLTNLVEELSWYDEILGCSVNHFNIDTFVEQLGKDIDNLKVVVFDNTYDLNASELKE